MASKSAGPPLVAVGAVPVCDGGKVALQLSNAAAAAAPKSTIASLLRIIWALGIPGFRISFGAAWRCHRQPEQRREPCVFGTRCLRPARSADRSHHSPPNRGSGETKTRTSWTGRSAGATSLRSTWLMLGATLNRHANDRSDPLSLLTMNLTLSP